MSMLTDLSKDYLKELDITLLGDIILILKHAKKVAEKQTQDRVLGDKDQVSFGCFKHKIKFLRNKDQVQIKQKIQFLAIKIMIKLNTIFSSWRQRTVLN